MDEGMRSGLSLNSDLPFTVYLYFHTLTGLKVRQGSLTHRGVDDPAAWF
jgi:hypothetical protein